MANKLIIGLSGAKQSGKSSGGKLILTEFINKRIGQKRYALEKIGKEVLVIDTFNNDQIVQVDIPSDHSRNLAETYSVKIYSFADPLKKFCIDVLGLDPIQCYGTDDDKNSATHISWEDLSEDIREKYSRPRRGSGGCKPASGSMTAREVMQIFGSDICRRMEPNCWARGLYSIIDNEGYDLAIVTDARFPNEVTMGTERGAKIFRLTRKISDEKHLSETALDDFPLGEYTAVIDNQNMTMFECHKILKGYISEYFKQYRLA